MRHLLILLITLILTFATSPTVISENIKALIPSNGYWIWVLNDSIIISKSLPKSLHGTWEVVPINSPPGVNVFVLDKGPWICKIEALNLLGKEVKPILIENASIPRLQCNSRYLWGNLRDLVDKGKYLVLFVPLSQDLLNALGSFSSSVCLDIKYNATITNSTMIINITARPLKPWIRICPPSKLVDVIVAWGRAKNVEVYFNGKVVFHSSNTK